MGAYVEPLTEFQGNGTSLFLAGGISGCPDWQSQVVRELRDLPVALLNPRRADFPTHDSPEAPAQIEWEHRHLRRATAILFWFPHETLCPISLYELGAWSVAIKPIFVGTHPAYERRLDVEVQTRLVRPEVTVVDSLNELMKQVRAWAAAQAP